MGASQVRKFDWGSLCLGSGASPCFLHLVSYSSGHVSAETLEAARVAAFRFLDSRLARQAFHLRLRSHPHNILRQNKVLSCAGADRLQTGMRGAFGRAWSMLALW